MNVQAKVTAPTEAGHSLENGDYVVKAETLRYLGDGDIKQGRRNLRLLIADEREQRVHKRPTDRPTTVRLAKQEDEVGVLALVLDDLSRNPQQSWAPTESDRVLEFIQSGTRLKGGIVGVIDGDDGLPVATTVMILQQPGHSKAWYLFELWNVVHPNHRRSRHAEDLLKFSFWCSDEWTRKFGYPIHYVAQVNSLEYLPEKLRFFRRRMTQVGGTFIYPTITR